MLTSWIICSIVVLLDGFSNLDPHGTQQIVLRKKVVLCERGVGSRPNKNLLPEQWRHLSLPAFPNLQSLAAMRCTRECAGNSYLIAY